MMRQMREATKPIMLFTAAAFVALMVFQWGMDITGQSGGGPGQIGRVNGEPVMYQEYMAAYRNLYDQVQNSQEEPITSQQDREIEDAAFDEVVNQILIRQELDRRGITVTDEEISQAARFSPPADLRPQFTDDEGRFDAQAYQAFLAQLPQEQLLLLEAYYRDVIPRGKLLRQVSSGIWLPDAELWRMYRDQNEEVEIRYVPLNPSTRFADSLFSVREADLRAYYEENEEEFEVPARASVRAVVLDKTPTAADTAATVAAARELREDIRSGAVSFADAAATESTDQATAGSGGELGVFGPGDMAGPFDSAVFAAPVGEVTEPVRTGFGVHLIEVQDRWGQDSVRARHILLPFERSDSSEIALLTRADSLEDLGEEMELSAAAEVLGTEATVQEFNENFPFLPGAGQIGEGADWAFEEAVPGDVSPVFENGQAFYALELISSEPAGVLPFDQARPAIESTLLLERKMERAQEEGAQLVEQVRGGEALPNAAAEAGLEVREAGPFSRTSFVPGMGRQNAAIGAAFGLEVGDLSDVVTTPANAFVIELLDRRPADSLAWREQLPQQRQAVEQRLQQERLQEWIEALRAAADIVDRRDQVLQPLEEEQQAPPMPMMF
jgi:parvulin-like peptidyl-prolyl isomerase